ncbi:MAG: hypothetical protein IPP96_07070 [Chitinophagaceae bacterium]|nr:hypothetical protein [Chitinophagaceae bacterium]
MQLLIGSTTTFQINDGGYKHQNTGFCIYYFQWSRVFANNSTVELNNSSSTGPSSVTFGNLIINFTTDPGAVVNSSGGITTINGNLTIQNTSTREFRLTGNTAVTTTIAKDLVISGGTFNVASGSGAPTLNVGGNFNQSGGTLTSTGSLTSIVFTGSGKTFTQSAGTLTSTNINWAVNNGASLTLINNLPVATTRTVAINGTLDCSTLAISGAGTVVVNNGGTIKLDLPTVPGQLLEIYLQAGLH